MLPCVFDLAIGLLVVRHGGRLFVVGKPPAHAVAVQRHRLGPELVAVILYGADSNSPQRRGQKRLPPVPSFK